MARMRRRFTAEFKGRVALEALQERDSEQAIAARVEALSRARPTAKARRRVENDPARRHSPSRTGATTPALVAGLPRAGSLLLPVGSQSRREE